MRPIKTIAFAIALLLGFGFGGIRASELEKEISRLNARLELVQRETSSKIVTFEDGSSIVCYLGIDGSDSTNEFCPRY